MEWVRNVSVEHLRLVFKWICRKMVLSMKFIKTSWLSFSLFFVLKRLIVQMDPPKRIERIFGRDLKTLVVRRNDSPFSEKKQSVCCDHLQSLRYFNKLQSAWPLLQNSNSYSSHKSMCEFAKKSVYLQSLCNILTYNSLIKEDMILSAIYDSVKSQLQFSHISVTPNLVVKTDLWMW